MIYVSVAMVLVAGLVWDGFRRYLASKSFSDERYNDLRGLFEQVEIVAGDSTEQVDGLKASLGSVEQRVRALESHLSSTRSAVQSITGARRRRGA